MRKLIVLAVAALVLGSSPSLARASQDYGDNDSHPLVLLSYALNPIGYTLEWLVTRPLHELVRQPDLGPVFGHDRQSGDVEEPIGLRVRRDSE